MRRIGIWLAVILLVLAGTYSGASWYAGREAETRIGQFVEQVNLELAAQWPVSEPQPVLRIDEYRRGWFSSRIRYSFVFHDQNGRPWDVAFRDALDHGPLPLSAVEQGDWRPALAVSRMALLPSEGLQGWFDAVPDGESPLTIDTRVAFDGQAHAVWTLSAARQPGDQPRWVFSGARLTVDFDPQTQATTLGGAVADLSLIFSETGERVVFKGVRFNSDNAFPADGSMQAHHRIQIEGIDLSQPDAPAIGIQDLDVRLDAARTGALTDGQILYTLGSVTLDQADLGQVELGMSAQRLDLQALGALRTAWESVADGDPDDIDDLSPDEQRLLHERLLPVLATSPSIAIEPLRWHNGQGQSQASFKADFSAADTATAVPGDLGGLIEGAIRQLRVMLEVSRPMLVETARRMNPGNADRMGALASMMFDHFSGRLARAGLIVLKDDVARLDLAYGAGQVSLNGRSMPVADFVAMVSPMVMDAIQ